MASITPQLETCSSESDKEAMEQIALSESPIQDIANSSTNNNIKGKPELHIKIAENFGNFFASLRENLFVVKRVVQNLWLQYIRGEKSDRIRAYQVWPGNNVCLCNKFNLLTVLRISNRTFCTSYAGIFLPREIHLWPWSKGATFDNHIHNSFKLDFCHVHWRWVA